MRQLNAVLIVLLIATFSANSALSATSTEVGSTKLAENKRSDNELWKKYSEAGSDARRQGNLKDAEEQFKLAIKTAEAFGPEDRRLSESTKSLAYLLYFEGRYDDAQPCFLKALALDKKNIGEKTIEVVSTLNILGRLNRHLGNYTEAEKYALQAIETRASVPGEDEPNKASLLHNLARVYDASGRRPTDAERLYKKVIEEEEEKLNDTITALSTYYNNLAMFYVSGKRYEDAENYLVKAIKVLTYIPGTELDVAEVCSNLGVIYAKQGHYPRAEGMFFKALETFSSNKLASPSMVNTTANSYISILKAMHRDAEAAKIAEKYHVKADVSSPVASDDPRIPPTNIKESVIKLLVATYPTQLSALLKGNPIELAQDQKNANALIGAYLSYVAKEIEAGERPTFIDEKTWKRVVQLWNAGKKDDALIVSFRPEEGDSHHIESVSRYMDTATVDSEEKKSPQ